MAPVLIAKVALENVSYHFDKAYDYCVPDAAPGSLAQGAYFLHAL